MLPASPAHPPHLPCVAPARYPFPSWPADELLMRAVHAVRAVTVFGLCSGLPEGLVQAAAWE